MSSASPEMINSLVESLAKISGPPPTALYGPPPPTAHHPPPSSSRMHDSGFEFPFPGRDFPYFHDDAALAPVVRTSKPPSGFSPLTNGSEESKRMSYHSGVDIPSYVRNYMNRADREEMASRGKGNGHETTTSRRASWSSSKKGSKLSCVSSWERTKKGSAPSVKSLDGSLHERELRMSTAGVLHTTDSYSLTELPELVGGLLIPQRTSSYGKGSGGPRVVSYPAAVNVVTTIPTHQDQMITPRLEHADDDAAPPPGFPARHPHHTKTNSKDKHHLKRRSSPPSLFSGNNGNNPPAPIQPKHRHNSHPVVPLSPTYWDDRPSSADSIDDAVDAYLCSPRLSQKLRMPSTGRTISFSEVGDPNGYAVFCCVGMGLTRFITAFYDELALSLGLRLITPDRPGVGDSDPIDESERTVLNWPDDVLYICQSLKITKFSLLAHSAGAIYALATALRMGNHIEGKIHLLAPWIPPSQMTALETQLHGTNGGKGGRIGTLPTTQRILRALPTPILKVANSSFMTATSTSLTTSLPRNSQTRKKRREKDRERERDIDLATKGNGESGGLERKTSASSSEGASGGENGGGVGKQRKKEGGTFSEDLSSEEAAMLRAAAAAAADKERQMTYDERLTHAIWTLSTRGANPAVDLLVCLERTRPVGFRYVDIMKPVVIHHGTKDNRVPVENVRWLGRTMRRCEVRELKSEGHGLMASAAVMGSVLEEIAGEWREWKRDVEMGGRGGGEWDVDGEARIGGRGTRSRSDTVNTLADLRW
ncbi:hypothetical protein BDZ91DRAFT_797636 [Kalaharituber pfeilii]|nr:hypothetical protein BDZ91DRAFT_797636 [Kalaharituber pfeilii]